MVYGLALVFVGLKWFLQVNIMQSWVFGFSRRLLVFLLVLWCFGVAFVPLVSLAVFFGCMVFPFLRGSMASPKIQSQSRQSNNVGIPKTGDFLKTDVEMSLVVSQRNPRALLTPLFDAIVHTSLVPSKTVPRAQDWVLESEKSAAAQLAKDHEPSFCHNFHFPLPGFSRNGFCRRS